MAHNFSFVFFSLGRSRSVVATSLVGITGTGKGQCILGYCWCRTAKIRGFARWMLMFSEDTWIQDFDMLLFVGRQQ